MHDGEKLSSCFKKLRASERLTALFAEQEVFLWDIRCLCFVGPNHWKATQTDDINSSVLPAVPEFICYDYCL